MGESKNAKSGKGHRADLQDQFSNARAYGVHFTVKPQKRSMLYFYWAMLDWNVKEMDIFF